MKKLILASRGSKLALAQAEQVMGLLEERGVRCELLTVKTKGDMEQSRPMHEIGGDGLFIREIEKALLDGRADAAVHSAKDLPYRLADGLSVEGTPEAASSCDCLISLKGDDASKEGPKVIGTGSPRRIYQYSRLDGEADFQSIRGNITTRLSKLDDGLCDAVILAKAGLERLNADLGSYSVREFSPDELIPAACQGIIAIECRSGDAGIVKLLNDISDEETSRRFKIERNIFCRLKADCSSAIAVHAKAEGKGLTVRALLGDRRVCVSGLMSEADTVCDEVFKRLAEGICGGGTRGLTEGVR